MHTKFGVNRNTHTHTYRKDFQPRDRWRNMTPMPLEVFIKKLQTNVGLGGYDILFTYFVVDVKSKMSYI